MKLDAFQVRSLAAPLLNHHPRVTVLVPVNRWSAVVAFEVAPAIKFEASDESDAAGDFLKAYVFPTGSWLPLAPPLDLVALGMSMNGDGTIDVGVIREEWRR